jgi:hypothetical protein
MINIINQEDYSIDTKHKALRDNTIELANHFSIIYNKTPENIQKNLQHYITSTVGAVRK